MRSLRISPFTRFSVGITLVIVALALSLGFFSFYIATRSATTPNEEYSVDGISDVMTIHRNEYGIPHIVAASDMDAFFGIGYAHAQDRLWQMDLARRFGRGTLSEIFGRTTLEYDIFMRHVGLHHIARRLVHSINPDSRAALEAYSRGVNAFLADHREKLPFEFDALGYIPEEWTPEDCLLIARLMAWELNMAFWSDAAFGAISDKLGITRAQQLVPAYPADAPMVLDSVLPPKKPSPSHSVPQNERITTATTVGITSRLPKNDDKLWKKFAAQSLCTLLDIAIRCRTITGKEGSAVGSNSWAVRAAAIDSLPRHRQGRPGWNPRGAILANDPHLTLSMPPRWYEAHLTSPDLNVLGLTIPGLPFVVIGRNDDIAWGLTNIMADDCDFFIERVDSTNFKRYIQPDGSSKTFKIVNDTLLLKEPRNATGIKDTLLEIRYTDRSAVLSDVHPFRQPRLTLNDSTARAKEESAVWFNRYLLTFRWTGQQMSDEILAFYRLNKAKNWERFLRAVHGFMVPGLNFSYADRRNNIGMAPAGAIPNRLQTRPGVDIQANFPRRAWIQHEHWSDENLVHLPEQFPALYNPERGFVVSANNQTARTLPFHVSSLWESPSRATRITELLADYQHYTLLDAALMQTDVVSPAARELQPLIIQNVRPIFSTFDTTERRAFALLERWKGDMPVQSAAAAIFNVFLERYVYNTLHDELGEALYRQYCFIGNVPTRLIHELSRIPALPDSIAGEQADTTGLLYWFDDKTTPALENRTDIIRKSYRQAIRYLRDFLQDGAPERWQYGKIHSLVIPHAFDGQHPIQSVMNLGPFPVGGNATTIQSAEWKFTKPFVPVIGASTRFVCDMQDTAIHIILPGGNSGQTLTNNYSNQIQLWLSGGLIPIPVSRTVSAAFIHRLVLTPKKE